MASIVFLIMVSISLALLFAAGSFENRAIINRRFPRVTPCFPSPPPLALNKIYLPKHGFNWPLAGHGFVPGKRLIGFCLLLFGATAGPLAWAGQADLVQGQFWSPERDAKVQFYKIGSCVCARFVWLREPGSDVNNPDASLRRRKLLNLEFLHGFVADGRDSWGAGVVYDPDSGKTYHGRFWFENGDHKRLYLRGYAWVAILGRTEAFQRVEPGE
ncbi:MAG: DUF2147 domain-containing protein [Opitutaceae bacterium]